jgi:hypothetical protein
MATCTLLGGDTASACATGVQAFQSAVTTEQNLRAVSAVQWGAYKAAKQVYDLNHSGWAQALTTFQANWNAGRTLGGSLVWDGNNILDCNSLSKCQTYVWPAWYDTNCNSASSQCQACSACGISRCTCTAGLDSQCNSGQCANHRYNANYSSYSETGVRAGLTWPAAITAWLAQNPEPQLPSPPDQTKYPDFDGVLPPHQPIPWTPFPNIICQSCEQCMNISSVAANNVSISQLQQSCVNNLQSPPTPSSPPSPTPIPSYSPSSISPTPSPAPSPTPPIYTTPVSSISSVSPMSSSYLTKNMEILIVLVFVLLIVIAISYSLLSGGEDEEQVDEEYGYPMPPLYPQILSQNLNPAYPIY